ncbi:glycine-rich protein family [Trichomonas vaginalis G3]|uniref:glycine-rich protein family n=1 Tax=Trichomonas vaginalis (strain ATCC PRA-98 / G3) TaxID=412133 RepID=UPI0021E58BB3|nr:glycine-rich protein family [Trichomonas vaginalis G3]KAI5532282.1 glycine-rich protein family [Trichomonas vaginalis G3]
MLDSSKGTANVLHEKGNEITFNYPCESNHDCTPYVAEIQAGRYIFEVWGAQGGQNGGLGGYAKGTISLKKNTTAFIYIGGQGSSNTNNIHPGGFNGGGTGVGYVDESYTGGGGGASDIRLLANSLYYRAIVAGGGGGIISYIGSHTEGFGGGEFGGDGYQIREESYPGKGGNQTRPGDSLPYSSLQYPGFGFGGSVGETDAYGSGGGGGWYGGSVSIFIPVAPEEEYVVDPGSGAGGGSGYVLTKDSYKPAGYFFSEDDYFMTDIDLSGRIKAPVPPSQF